MIRRLALASVLFLTVWLTGAVQAQNFPLVTGETLYGAPVDFAPAGVVFKRPDGSLTLRVAWTNFTQNSLKVLVKEPKAKPYVEPLIEVEDEPPPAALAKKAVPAIKVTVPPRLDRPDPRAGWGSLFSSPLTLTLLLLVYAANLYAAFEISLFRGYHPALAMGVAAVVPLIGPALFLCLPTHVIMGEAIEEEATAEAGPTATEAAPAEAAPQAAEAAAPAKTAAQAHQSILYRRGETMFNRRFFETKLAGFLRIVPSEAEKDLVIFVKSSRGDHTGPKIVRIGPNEITLQVIKAGASADVIIPFNEIQEVHVRHKDA